MSKFLLSGVDITSFNYLEFSDEISADWISLDELMDKNTGATDDNTKFILLYSSPESFLSTLNDDLLYCTTDILIQAKQQWQSQVEMLMHFYLMNKNKAIFVHEEQLFSNIEGANALIFNKFNVNLAISLGACSNTESNKYILEQLVNLTRQLALIDKISEDYSTQECYENILYVSDLLMSHDCYSIEQRKSSLAKRCDGYVVRLNEVCLEHSKLVMEKSVLANKISKLTSENEASLFLIQRLQGEIASTSRQNKKLNQEFSLLKGNVIKSNEQNESFLVEKKALEQEKTNLFNELSESVTQNELTLLQLQEHQGKLESAYHQNKCLNQELSQYKENTDRAKEKSNILLEDKKQLEQVAASLVNELSESVAQNELTLLQLTQLQEELEGAYNQSNSLNQELSQCRENTDEVKEKSAILFDDKKKLEQEKADLVNELSESVAQNELTLLQLQQLQEELECSINKSKRLKQEQLTQKENIEHLKKIDREKAENNSIINGEISTLRAENKMALLQIHQLQEELDCYFIKYQAISGNGFINSIHNVDAIKLLDKRFKQSLLLAKHLQA